MSTLLLVGIVLAGVPALLIIGFAAVIFWGFVTDDVDAKNVLKVTLIVMAIGILLILGHVIGSMISVSP